MGVPASVNKLGAEFVTQGKGVFEAAKGMFAKGSSEAVAHAPKNGGIISGVFGAIGGAAGKTVKFSTGLAFKVIEAPLTAGIWAVRMGVKGVGTFYTKMPRTAWIGTGILGAAGVGSAIAARNEARSNAYYQQQISSIQQQQNPYRLQEGEYTQNVAPHLKESGQNTGFAAAEQQRTAANNAASL